MAYSTGPTWRSWLPLVLYCFAIFLLSSFPGHAYPQVTIPLADKIVHIVLYTGLGMCAALYFSVRGLGPMAAFTFCVLYGLSDELHQLFIPLRSFSLGDLMADGIGGGVGIMAFQGLTNRLNHAHTKPIVSNTDNSEIMELT